MKPKLKEKGRKKNRSKKERIAGITRVGSQTEAIEAVQRGEGFDIFRKGGEKLECTVKKKRLNKNKNKETVKKKGSYTKQIVKTVIKYTYGRPNSIYRIY